MGKRSKKSFALSFLALFIISIFSLFTFSSSSFLTGTVYASTTTPNLSSSAYHESNIFTISGYYGQCTWFGYGRTLEKLGIKLNSQFYGNATTWWDRNTTYPCGQVPKANSLAIWGGGSSGCGHVAFVEAVSGTTVYFNEANHHVYRNYDGALESLSITGMKSRGSLYLKGYIYLTNESGGGTQTGFTYPNNAVVSGDFFYVRDSYGNIIPGRYVSDGDKITILDVSYSKQLVYVEYPTASGVRTGYISNVPSLIHYYYQGQWKNGSTSETVYDQNGAVIGSIDPYEAATPIYRKNGMLHVVYNTSKGTNTKSGYVHYNGGFSKF